VDKKVFHYTIGRCGSTLISQILRYLYGVDHVQAGHEVVKVKQPIIITNRDFRDVLVSKWRTNGNISFKALADGRKLTDKEVKLCANVIKGDINNLNKVAKDNPHYHLLRYEDFVGDKFDFIFSELEGYLNIKITDEQRKFIIENYSFDANKKKADKFNTFKKWTSDYVHGLHLYKGEVGSWKNLIPQNLHGYVNRYLANDLKTWGYEV
jgi:hypothetical protein